MTFGAYHYDTEHRLLYRGGEEIMVSLRATAVLERLLEGAGRILSKDELLATAWQGAYVGEDSLTQAISQLRAALGDDARNPKYIQTVPRRGYRFIGRVEAFDDPASDTTPAGPPFATASADPPVATALKDPPVAAAPPSPPAQLQVSHGTDHVSVWVKAEAFQVFVQVDREGLHVAASRISAA